MCVEQPWWQIGLSWTVVGVTVVVCAVMFSAIGWKAHAVAMWRKRMKHTLHAVGSLAKMALVGVAGLVTLCFLAWSYMFA